MTFILLRCTFKLDFPKDLLGLLKKNSHGTSQSNYMGQQWTEKGSVLQMLPGAQILPVCQQAWDVTFMSMGNRVTSSFAACWGHCSGL
jgi:hypothetical protein